MTSGHPARAKTPDSPCTGVCVLDPVSRFCRGCARTGDEIAAWPALTSAERRRIMATLPARTSR